MNTNTKHMKLFVYIKYVYSIVYANLLDTNKLLRIDGSDMRICINKQHVGSNTHETWRLFEHVNENIAYAQCMFSLQKKACMPFWH